jgi:hypothetical protein
MFTLKRFGSVLAGKPIAAAAKPGGEAARCGDESS